MRKIRLTENQFNKLVAKCVRKALNEEASRFAKSSANYYFGQDQQNAQNQFLKRYGNTRRPDVNFNKDLQNMDYDMCDDYERTAKGMQQVHDFYSQNQCGGDAEYGFGC